MGMALHSDGSYEDVLALISDGLSWAERAEGSPKLANKAAISHARDRLGAEPMEKMFRRVKPLAADDATGCWLAGRRLVAVDGTCLDLANTPANDTAPVRGWPRVRSRRSPRRGWWRWPNAGRMQCSMR